MAESGDVNPEELEGVDLSEPTALSKENKTTKLERTLRGNLRTPRVTFETTKGEIVETSAKAGGKGGVHSELDPLNSKSETFQKTKPIEKHQIETPSNN